MVRKALIGLVLGIIGLCFGGPVLADSIRVSDAAHYEALNAGASEKSERFPSAGMDVLRTINGSKALLTAALKPRGDDPGKRNLGTSLFSAQAVINVPEPSSQMQLGIGLLALALVFARHLR